MRLYLKNIGKLKEADIKLEGITVVAGENNSGKSTVGKALYGVYNAFEIFGTRTKCSIYQKSENLSEYINRNLLFPDNDPEYEILSDDLLRDEISFEMRKSGYSKLFKRYNPDVSSEILEDISEELAEIHSITDEDFAIQYLNLSIEGEFTGQISHLFSEEDGILQLATETVSGNRVARFTVIDNEIKSCEGLLDFPCEALYIDNPFILDESFDEVHNNSHQRSLKYKLKKSPSKDQAITQIQAEKKLKNVLALLNTVCEGELSFQNTITYRLGKTGKSLDIKNLSTGLKSFAILKTLLLNGALARGSVLILDEPEIHLHPEWQLVYAELIVLLQKEFKLTILLTTHSPYFLRALEVYAGKYEIANKCNYYFAKNEGQEAMIYDVTEDKSEVFQKLSRPLQNLENMRWQNEG